MAAQREPESAGKIDGAMARNPAPTSAQELPCTWQPASGCEGCEAGASLMCRLDKKDMLVFFLIVLPFAFTAIAGTIAAGYGWYLLVWLAYSLFFFFVWEAYVLCRHCPFWAEPGKVLRCHANYGVLKIWKYVPGPMSPSEKAQFLVGVSIWMAFPFPFLLMGGEYVWALVVAAAVAGGIFALKKSVCNRCVNFSCPVNAVPAPLVEAYLRRNPQIHAAWHASIKR